MDNKERELVRLASNVLNNDRYKNTANMLGDAKKAKLSVECDIDVIQQLRNLIRRILENDDPQLFFRMCLGVFGSIYTENFKDSDDEDENMEKVD
jgi:ubiquinone biosynthesis protein UbiJ